MEIRVREYLFRLAYDPYADPRRAGHGARVALSGYMAQQLIGADLRESLVAIYFDGEGRMLGFCNVARGSGNVCRLTPADVLTPALRLDAKAAADRIAMRRGQLAEQSRAAALELRRLREGDLRGMFDGPTTGGIDLDAPLVSLDLSAVYASSALGVLMACAAAWLHRAVSRRDGIRRLLVVDEAWAILRNLGVARWLASAWKLSRAFDVQCIAITHRLSDLTAAGDAGAEHVQLARGLLADSETRVIHSQRPEEVRGTQALLDLTEAETEVITCLPRGSALWNVGQHAAVVEHLYSGIERWITATDAA